MNKNAEMKVKEYKLSVIRGIIFEDLRYSMVTVWYNIFESC